MVEVFNGVWVLNDVYDLKVTGDWPAYVAINTANYGWFNAGSSGTPTNSKKINRISYSNDTANGEYRCDMTAFRESVGAVSSSTKGWFAGGNGSGGLTNVIESITYASDTTNAVDRSDLLSAISGMGGVSNGINGWFGGGVTNNVIQRLVFATDTANTTDRSDLTQARTYLAGVSNGTNGWFLGGVVSSPGVVYQNIVDRLVYSTDTTNAADRCDLTIARSYLSGFGDASYGWTAGGDMAGPARTNVIDRITFASDTANASDRCDMLGQWTQSAASSNGTNGWIVGGNSITAGTTVNTVQRVTYATDTANAIDRADMPQTHDQHAGMNNSSAAF